MNLKKLFSRQEHDDLEKSKKEREKLVRNKELVNTRLKSLDLEYRLILMPKKHR